MSDARRQLGNRGEELAAQALQAAGLRIVERNWRGHLLEINHIRSAVTG